MKNIFKALIISLLLCTSCIELAVGTAVVASGTYIAKQGYLEDHVDRSFDSSWQNLEKYTSEIGEVTYNSKNEGVIKVDFPDGGSGTFMAKKVTERATLMSLRTWRYALPNNPLAEMHFSGLMEQVQ
jgi:hypothetical protein